MESCPKHLSALLGVCLLFSAPAIAATPQPNILPEFDVIGNFGGVGSSPPGKLVGTNPMGNNRLVDWGVWPPDNLVRSYLASTSFVDAQIGRLMKTLAETGRDKDTIGKDSPPAPGSASRILTYDPTTDIAVWDGKPITRKDPIPQ